jgi:hypothetical protein
MSASHANTESAPIEFAPGCHTPPQTDGIDASLLEDSLALSPWERMQANDDALNFGGALRAAMERRRA